MRVTDVEPFSLELTRPLVTANGELREREGFLVHVEGEGETGVGEATPLPGWTESLSACRDALARVAERPEVTLESLGDTPAARHAVESALVDCRARAAGESLAAWLADGDSRDSVPVNATVGNGTVTETVEAAREAAEAGFTALKVKVGARDLATDRERLSAVRSACPDLEVRADANGTWDRAAAAEAVQWAADLDLSYLEQPCPATDLDGHGDLRGRGVDIALDEGLGEHGVSTVLEADVADVLILKPMALGGPVAAREAALDAREAGLDAVFTTTIDGAYARAAAVHVAASLPDVPACGLATGDLLVSDLLSSDPVPVSAGRIRVTSGPGLY